MNAIRSENGRERNTEQATILTHALTALVWPEFLKTVPISSFLPFFAMVKTT